MAAHKKDFTKAVELYLNGDSIEKVAKIFEVSRQAMHKALKRRGVVMRSKVQPGAKNHFFVHGEGYDQKKNSAKTSVMKAIRSGSLVREACEKCGRQPEVANGRNVVQAHHEDYDQPLVVRWLCQACHYSEHHT